MEQEEGEREKEQVTLESERKGRSTKELIKTMKHNNDKDSDRLINEQQVCHFLKQTP